MFRNFFANIPIVLKTILLINIAMFVLGLYLPAHISDQLALYSFRSTQFKPLQLLTHMFMHGDFVHIFFNMFTLFIFGRALESYWGAKRFFVYYFITGIGGALFYLLVKEIEVQVIMSSLSPEYLEEVVRNGGKILSQGMNYNDTNLSQLNAAINVPCVGASGAVYALLLAFGVMFPNTPMYIYFAIPVKAKYMVIFFIISELVLGIINSAGDNVAHFAHLGGMVVGIIILLFWRKKGEI